MPFAVILGEDELAQGKVKIKEMGLPEGHPEKDGVMVEKSNLVQEVRERLRKFKEGEDGTQEGSSEIPPEVAELTDKVEETSTQDRPEIPGEPPVIPTVT